MEDKTNEKKDEIIEINYAFFGYVAKDTYVQGLDNMITLALESCLKM